MSITQDLPAGVGQRQASTTSAMPRDPASLEAFRKVCLDSLNAVMIIVNLALKFKGR